MWRWNGPLKIATKMAGAVMDMVCVLRTTYVYMYSVQYMRVCIWYLGDSKACEVQSTAEIAPLGFTATNPLAGRTESVATCLRNIFDKCALDLR